MKSGFQTELDARLKEGNDAVWVIHSPLKYYSEILGRLIVVPTWFETEPEVPSGEPLWFETDFASVPRVPIVYELWGNRAHREGVLHDYLFREDSIPVVSWSMANKIFLEAMKSTGKPKRLYYPMYWGVVIGSYPSYHKKRVKDKL
jgi:hypothetical protein